MSLQVLQVNYYYFYVTCLHMTSSCMDLHDLLCTLIFFYIFILLLLSHLIVLIMKEEFLHYLWKYGLYDPDKLIDNEGNIIQVIHPGEYNHDSGPDFFNARILIEVPNGPVMLRYIQMLHILIFMDIMRSCL